MLPFRVYYGDGTTFEGKPEDAPCTNVQCIAYDDTRCNTHDIGRFVLSDYDIYIYSDPIGWHGTNKYADLIQHLHQGCGLGGVRAVLTGLWIDRDTFYAIRERATIDPPFRSKSAGALVEDGTE
jgi:hypothetical protein